MQLPVFAVNVHSLYVSTPFPTFWHALFDPSQYVHNEHDCFPLSFESPGHGAPAHVSAESHAPALFLHIPLVAYPHDPAPLQKSPAQLFNGFSVHSEYVSTPFIIFWQALLDPSQYVHNEHDCFPLSFESPGHAWALQVSAASQAPALALQT